jgi:glucose/arabinose dehydrogenase
MWAMTPKNARRRHGVWLTGLAVAFASFAAASPGSAAQAAAGHTRALRRAETVPPGFTDTVVANVNEPVAMTATPDGRILVVDQTGKIRVIRNGKLFATPALDISAKVCATNSERGMLGIAVDPKFATNGFRLRVLHVQEVPDMQARHHERASEPRVALQGGREHDQRVEREDPDRRDDLVSRQPQRGRPWLRQGRNAVRERRRRRLRLHGCERLRA